MARVTVTEIEKNDGVAIIRPNTTLTSWTNQSAAVDDENVAVEGIDGRNVVLGSVYVDETAAGKIFTYTGTTQVINVADGTIQSAGGNPVRIGPFTYSLSTPPMMLKVTCCLAFTDSSALLAAPAYFKLYKSTDGGAAYVAIGGTTRAASRRQSINITHLDRAAGSSNQVYYALYAWQAGGLNPAIGRIEFFVEKRLK